MRTRYPIPGVKTLQYAHIDRSVVYNWPERIHFKWLAMYRACYKQWEPGIINDFTRYDNWETPTLLSMERIVPVTDAEALHIAMLKALIRNRLTNRNQANEHRTKDS